MEQDQAFVENLVKELVNHPEDVKTERKVDERGVLITLYVNPSDMGYVIGRKGQTAEAIRRLTRTVGAKYDARVNLRIFEPEESRRNFSKSSNDDDFGSSDSGLDDVDTSAVEDLNI